MLVDGIDRRLIALLRRDGRLSYRRLGDEVGFTIMGAKRRVEKLIGRGIIRITALENIRELGYHAAIIMLEVESQKALTEILRRFENCPRVVNVFTMLSGYNLAALVVAEDRDTLESEAWESCSLRSQAGVRRSEFYPIGEVYYSPFLPVREELRGGDASTAPCGVNCGECERYDANRCRGCPATKYYRLDRSQ